jgi:chromosome segregation ATPase
VVSLKDQMEEIVRRFMALRESNAAVEKDKQQLATELGQMQSQYNLSVRQLALLKDELFEREQELESERGRSLSAEQQIVAIKGDYVDLKEKYGKLVRPARSAAGRTIVEVRFTKSSGINLYQFRVGGTGEYTNVNRQQLEQRLDALKAKEPNNLFVRIIIPQDSGLSYNDALGLTTRLHRKYDYYFQ